METPSLMNFKNLLAYPFKDQKSGTKILIGSLLIFSSAIIPILPALIVLGYIMQIAKRIITLDYISLVNLIMDKEVVKELIQGNLTSKNLKQELSKILQGPARNSQLEAYDILEQKLGGIGASEKAARLIVENA